MHEAVFSCLVARGEAYYSVFLSYRAASDAPLASLLFDELNHRQCRSLLLAAAQLRLADVNFALQRYA